MPRLDPGGLSGAFRRTRRKASLDFLVPERDDEESAGGEPVADAPSPAPESTEVSASPPAEPTGAKKTTRKKATRKKAAQKTTRKKTTRKKAAKKTTRKKTAAKSTSAKKTTRKKTTRTKAAQKTTRKKAAEPQAAPEPPVSHEVDAEAQATPAASAPSETSARRRRTPSLRLVRSASWQRSAVATPRTRQEWWAPGTPAWPRARGIKAWALRSAERLVGRLLRAA